MIVQDPVLRSLFLRRSQIMCLVVAITVVFWATPMSRLSHADVEFEVPAAISTVGEQPDRRRSTFTRIVQLTAEKIRLEAERDAAAELHFPAAFVTRHHSAAAAAVYESRLFATRRASVSRQKGLLGQRIVQIRHEIDGLLLQQKARQKEIKLIREELQLIDDMHRRKLANFDRLRGLQRLLVRSEGELGGLVSQLARARAQIEEIELQIAETEQKTMLEVHKQIRDVEALVYELSERHQRDGE